MMRADRCTRHRPSASRQHRRLARPRRPLRSRHLLRRRHRLHPRRPGPPDHQRQCRERFHQQLGDMRTVRLGPIARDAMVLVVKRYA